MERFAVIMAGGSGTRLWPLSREKKPKQFISIDDGKCMLVQTIERICKCVPAVNCYIITNENLMEQTREAVKDIIPCSNIIPEPLKKNTAACISYAAMLLKKEMGEGLLCFVPADGYVSDHDKYRDAIENAFTAAGKQQQLVVIGITPAYPATAYGYIKVDESAGGREKVAKVREFTEKPDYERAKQMISTGEYLWNGGILAGSIEAIIQSVKTFLPDHYIKIADALEHYGQENFNKYIGTAYNELQNISFDNGVLEKCRDISVVKGDFDWDDIGSIDTLSKTLKKDDSENSCKGDCVGLQTSNSIIYGDGILITAIGLDNMIIAGTREAVIVCPREKAQEVKNLVEELKQRGYDNYL
jgi:mannose-1-phosphate guanylyltransferase